jgi:Cu(I)/Ag(I) efflux system periplasmic protein CusF
MKKILVPVFSSLLLSTSAVWATNHQADATLTEGEVRKVDTETKKLTLKHAEIKNLGMPGMTMVFQVKDPAMLEQVKPGDKVRFTAEKVNGAITVTSLEAAK